MGWSIKNLGTIGVRLGLCDTLQGAAFAYEATQVASLQILGIDTASLAGTQIGLRTSNCPSEKTERRPVDKDSQHHLHIA